MSCSLTKHLYLCIKIVTLSHLISSQNSGCGSQGCHEGIISNESTTTLSSATCTIVEILHTAHSLLSFLYVPSSSISTLSCSLTFDLRKDLMLTVIYPQSKLDFLFISYFVFCVLSLFWINTECFFDPLFFVELSATFRFRSLYCWLACFPFSSLSHHTLC